METYKPFYKDRKDALEDAGITDKQLRHWREHGVFKPQLGPGTKKFTQRDIQQLKFLKRLIVHFGFGVEAVRQLLDEADLKGDWSFSPWGCTFLDLRRGVLVNPHTALRLLLHTTLEAFGDPGFDEEKWDIEPWLFALAATQFSFLAFNHRDPAVYKASRDVLLERIKHMDLVGRVRSTRGQEGPFYLFPTLDDDPPLDEEQLQQLAKEKWKHFDRQ